MRQAYLWLRQAGSGAPARRKIAAIRDAIRRLKAHPCRHAAGDYSPVRELPCAGGYRVFYELSPDTYDDATSGDVLILRVFGPGQDRSRL